MAADVLTGKCIGISDGDTVKVLVSGKQVKVRLEGIDCPESHQDYGNKAKQFTAKLIFGKDVTVKVTDTDRYGRAIGRITVNGTDVNLAIVRAGLAWHYKAYSSEKALADAETAARRARIGLWSHPHPIPPWDFRKGRKAAPARTQPADAEKGFWLNTSSGVRHNSSCKNYGATKRGRPAAKTEGKACGICGG